VSNPQAAERAALGDELHVRYGYRLFADDEVEQALAQFGMCSASNPLVLLRLFPSLAPRRLLAPVAPLFSGALPTRRMWPAVCLSGLGLMEETPWCAGHHSGHSPFWHCAPWWFLLASVA
jgi:hypothetical protein